MSERAGDTEVGDERVGRTSFGAARQHDVLRLDVQVDQAMPYGRR